MLKRRIISAAIIVSVMIAILWLDHYLGRPEVQGHPGLVLGLITSAVTVLATCELVRMWRGTGCQLSYLVAILGSLLLSTGACLPLYWPHPLGECPVGFFGGTLLGLFAGLVVATAHEMWWFDQPGSEVERLSRYVFSFGYLAMFIGMVAPHRRLEGFDVVVHNGSGLCAILAIVVTAKMSDAFAFAFGKLWGRQKLAPQLSPNKTIEGAIGAVVGGLVGAAVVFYVVGPFVADKTFIKPIWWVAIYGVVLSLAGMLGDLAESLIKRDANCKDSSHWMPGLGGVLDVIDSVIFAAPASLIVWLLL